MTDIDIIRLLWIRDEIAIEELEINYGHYCRQISWGIVQNREDVNECLNDTWWKTWCSIPENRPDSLRAYVARITRNLSLNKIDRDDFVQRLNGFLEKQTRTDRMIFVLRFWYMETPREIAKHMGLKEKNVYNTLYQMRKRFRVYWEQSGKEDIVYEKA